MTDILIPLGKGSRHQDIELRYCLRSIEKYLSGVGNVWIVGERPEWLQDVVHIPMADNTNNWNRARNIYQKVMAGINQQGRKVSPLAGGKIDEGCILSDHFLFMNDDHYLLQNYEAGEFPYYHRGCVDLRNMLHNEPQYTQYNNTRKVLHSGFLDFGVHCPILYHTALFTMAFKDLTWPEYGYEIKSIFANYIDTAGQYIDDLKFSQPALPETIYRLLEDRPWFSVGDRALKAGGMLQVLQEFYPEPSKYEKS